MDSDAVWTEGPALSAWIYDSPRGAAAGKVRLERLSQRGAVVVVDAATVTWVKGAHRPRIGRPHVATMMRANRTSPLEVLLGHLVFPSAGSLDGPAGLDSALHGTQLTEDFLLALRAGFAPDTSTLLVLSSDAAFDEVQVVIERGRARGDVRLLHTPLGVGGMAALDAFAHTSARPDR
ncbi:Uncharacterized membrane protein [Nocardioides terrae]|uniref:Uncharacterized membrane protein n=1 Tax=Nocardioides terrae TaxID=574651 RepID=A0A1I1K6R5_9ACTN|nr:hypothetical protein [Nocardioides terrae]SFC56677.1 Uncharacterized membrane protein [Nocardioides terrae]